ncbi:MAG: Gfo/Idh/MocA family oxidoreductase, partial [Firmicutes bacterium]|nr:Gfo/Idh/MocA family oxidoreductase [Bacillota bacterium]
MNDRPIGFGVVGLGFGYGHCRRIQQVEGAVLVAVSDLSRERGEKASAEFGVPWYAEYEAMLQREDLDVVVIATPSGLHGQLGAMAARYGKHVISEKPLEVTTQKAEELIDACRSAGVRLAVNYPLRFYPDLRRTKVLLTEGRLGRILLAEARLKWYRSQEYYDGAGWRGTWSLDGGGALMNQTIHQIDLLQWLVGKVSRLMGHYETINHAIETEDLGLGLLKFESGAVGTVLGTTACNPDMGTEIIVHGTAGTVILRNDQLASVHIDGVDDPVAYFNSIPLD